MEEKKSTYRGYTEAQGRASTKYIKENLEPIQIRVKKGEKDRYKRAAEAEGKSLQRFILDALEKEIEAQEKKAQKKVHEKRARKKTVTVSEVAEGSSGYNPY